MRAVVVVVVAPGRDQLAGLADAVVQVLFQALVPEPAVNAFDEAALHPFAGHDMVPLDIPVFLPFEDGIRGELRAVVGERPNNQIKNLRQPAQQRARKQQRFVSAKSVHRFLSNSGAFHNHVNIYPNLAPRSTMNQLRRCALSSWSATILT